MKLFNDLLFVFSNEIFNDLMLVFTVDVESVCVAKWLHIHLKAQVRNTALLRMVSPTVVYRLQATGYSYSIEYSSWQAYR